VCDQLTNVDGGNRFARIVDDDPGVSGTVDCESLSGAAGRCRASFNDVTVVPGWQTRVESSIERSFVRDDDESLVTSRVRRLVALGPPVRQRLSVGGLGEAGHTGDRPPTVLADPTVTTRSVGVDDHVLRPIHQSRERVGGLKGSPKCNGSHGV